MDFGPLRILVIQHEADAGPGLLGERLAAAGCAITIAGPDGAAPDIDPVPAFPDGYDGVIVLGGTPGPSDDADAPWLPAVRGLIGTSLDLGVPFLGICLGAQLLAEVAGGRVAPLEGGPEIGVLPLWLTAAAFSDPLFGGLDPPLQSMQWHELEIAELPPGARALCSGDRCVHQAFRVGRDAWGLQFHLEVLADGVAAWARDDARSLAAADLDARELVEDMKAAESGLRAVWEPVADRWVRLCIARRDGSGSA